jgi:excisionase family DNA binding protein
MDVETRELLTVEQAAQYLQVSQSSIRSYIRQGRLQAFRIAGKRKVLIPRAALLALLEPARPEDIAVIVETADGPDTPEEKNGSHA